jgi:hypothetical protein
MRADVRSRQRQGRLSQFGRQVGKVSSPMRSDRMVTPVSMPANPFSTEIKTRRNRPAIGADAFFCPDLTQIAQMSHILPTTTPEAQKVAKAIWQAIDGADVGSTIAALTTVLVGIFMDIEQPDRDDASGCFAMTFYDVTTRHPKFQQEMMLAEWDPKVRAN